MQNANCSKCHTSRATIDLMKNVFGEQLISRLDTISCDLILQINLFGEFVKGLVYNDKIFAIAGLEANIERVIGEIPSQVCVEMAENSIFRMDHLKRSSGQHLPEIIFTKWQLWIY